MNNYRLFADTYNGTQHFDMVKYAQAGHSLIAIKASEGVGFIDELHAGRCREAHARGLTVLHYHFARPDTGTTPQMEAQRFVQVVKPTWVKGDYLWLDIERMSTRGAVATAKWCEEFNGEVHRLFGATPIVYGSESFLNNELGTLKVRGERFSPAKYGGTPSVLARRRWKWSEQFTDGVNGHLPHGASGIGPCDMNELNLRTALYLRVRTARRRWRILHPISHSKVVNGPHAVGR